MSQLDHKGPDKKGPKTGRELGICNPESTEQTILNNLGIGQGLKRKSGGGKGKKKRLKYNIKVNN